MQSFSNPFKSPSTMRAWTHTRRGPPSFVLKQAEIPVPELNNSASVLVRISHAALNPGSSILMHTIPFLFRSAAAVPETDFSGEIVSVGESIPEDRKKEIQPGTAVFGSIPVPYHLRTGIGALAEYAVVDVSCVTAKPENATFAEASGLPIAGVTALQLMEHSGLKRGDKVLVNGASGGIGTFVVQMCRDVVGDSGLVVGICSGKNAEMVQELGADEVSTL
jgi:NADPH:quinone reductase-like Zn-dependent oxidoreductase